MLINARSCSAVNLNEAWSGDAAAQHDTRAAILRDRARGLLDERIDDGVVERAGDVGMIVRRATAPDPASRYRTAAALGDEIRAFLDGMPVIAYHEGPLERLGRFGARHRVAILLFSAYVVMRALILVFRGI